MSSSVKPACLAHDQRGWGERSPRRRGIAAGRPRNQGPAAEAHGASSACGSPGAQAGRLGRGSVGANSVSGIPIHLRDHSTNHFIRL